MTKALQLTAALEDYLEAIFNLCRHDAAARSRDIAESLRVHKSTVTAALRALGQMELVNYAPYEAVTLTREGRRLAADVVRRHAALKDFFIHVLKVNAGLAENAACDMEHSIPREIVTKLAGFAIRMRGCPRLDGFDETETAVRPNNPEGGCSGCGDGGSAGDDTRILPAGDAGVGAGGAGSGAYPALTGHMTETRVIMDSKTGVRRRGRTRVRRKE